MHHGAAGNRTNNVNDMQMSLWLVKLLYNPHNIVLRCASGWIFFSLFFLVLILRSFTPPVHEADVLGAIRTRFTDRRPGAGGSDRRVAWNQAEIRAHPETGTSPHHSLLQRSADAAGTGRHLRWSQPEISRTAGNFSTVCWCLGDMMERLFYMIRKV